MRRSRWVYFMMVLLLAVVALGLAGVVGFAWLGYQSRQAATPALVAGRLAPCPESPNCWRSESDTAAGHRLNPLPLPSDSPWQAVVVPLIEQLGGRVVSRTPDLLSAEFRSDLFGFVDDLQLRVDRVAAVVQLRAASRVGHSDLGVNRQRVEQLRALWSRALSPGSETATP